MEEFHNEHLDRKEKQIGFLNKLGAYSIPLIAIVAWIVGICYFIHIGGGSGNIEFGDFATHPIFMATAFLLLGNFSVCCQPLCEDLGISQGTAKWIHISLNTLVLIFAWIGWGVIYELHNKSDSHYKGSHSRVGIFTISMWIVYYISGFFILFFAPKKRLETLHDVHYIFGTMCIILALWTIALGLMWEEYSYDKVEDGFARRFSCTVLVGLMLMIFIIFGMFKFGRMLLPK